MSTAMAPVVDSRAEVIVSKLSFLGLNISETIVCSHRAVRDFTLAASDKK
jgi:hypothetical protein